MKRLAVIISLVVLTQTGCVSLNEFLGIQQKTHKRKYIARPASKPAAVSKNLPEIIEIPPASRGWHTIHGKIFHKNFEEIISARKTDKCHECHMKSEYRIFDPHNQLNASGGIIEEKCLYCHRETPDVGQATFKDIKLIEGPERICMRCHSSNFLSRHPANANHVRRPSDKMLAMIREFESLMDVTLPLDYYGKIMCATCHNPHEKGVIPSDKAGARGAGEKARVRLPERTAIDSAHMNRDKLGVRMPGRNDQICLACHLDK